MLSRTLIISVFFVNPAQHFLKPQNQLILGSSAKQQPFAAVFCSAYECAPRARDVEHCCQKVDKRGIGSSLNRWGGESNFEGSSMETKDLVTRGPWLEMNMEKNAV